MTEQKSYDDMNVEDLQKIARERDIQGRSTMNKEELAAAISKTDSGGPGDPDAAIAGTGGDLNNPTRDDEINTLSEPDPEAAAATHVPDAPAGTAMRDDDRKLAEKGKGVDKESRVEIGLKGERRIEGTEQFSQPPHATPDSESLSKSGAKPLTEGDEVVAGPNA